MNKKLIIVLACSALLMGLAACSSTETASTSNDSKTEQATQKEADKAKKTEEKEKLNKEKEEQKKADEQQKLEEKRKKEEEQKKQQDEPTTTGNTIKGLKDELSIGMPFKDYLAKKKSLNVENPLSISLGKGNVGSVLQAQDGVLVVCIDGEKIFDLKTFKNVDEAKEYEKSLKVKQ